MDDSYRYIEQIYYGPQFKFSFTSIFNGCHKKIGCVVVVVESVVERKKMVR